MLDLGAIYRSITPKKKAKGEKMPALEWGAEDSVIIAHRLEDCDWRLPGSVEANCELCSATVLCGQTSAEQAKLPGWHLVCHPCVSSRLQGRTLLFGGRVNPETPKPWEAK